ncbi:hypothetical protein [Actinomycetospora corticicola]|uniref:Replication protein n=1 Tax=Actinomycetospora corticicola TaxID=663602 RepID=A0A7Y9DZV8_9PSEU|nr:hypothetical protein [Actinomycetospora corticicola]NYD38564.1 hypothetical protein [Actinomycetospora corticicola]
MLDQDAGVTLAVTNNADGTRTAGFSGLATCGSVWCCPQCAAKIATRRADELARVMRAVEERGGSAFLLTLTMRHARGDRLGLTGDERRRLSRLREKAAEYATANELGWDFDERQAEADAIEEQTLRERRGCWDVLSDAWARVTSGAAWKADQELFGGLLGWARVVEVTDGGNGWHVHIHALLCFSDNVSADVVSASVGARVFARWSNALARAGFDASEEHGWDLRKVQLGDGDLADYFTKIAHEVTGSHRKEGRRKGGRTPMQLLVDAIETYEESTLARWWEWETASENRRQLTWSTGARDLRKLAGLVKDMTDEEIASEDLPADEHLALPADNWRSIVAGRWEAELLSKAENAPFHSIRNWILERTAGRGPLNKHREE